MLDGHDRIVSNDGKAINAVTNMELRVLRYFLGVAREGNITRAANFLHVTQPTLSRQLMDLEEELGHKLFIRGSHHVKLTHEGLILKERAQEILNMVERTTAEFASGDDSVCGEIYIGGGETYVMKRIASVANTLRELHPGIRFHLYSGNADDVTERLDKGLLDFGVLIQPADLSKYDYINLPDKDLWGVIMRKDSPLACQREILRKDLLEVPLLCSRQAMKRGSSFNEFTSWFGEDFERLNIVATFNLIYNAALMVEEGLGCAVGIDGIVNTGGESNLCFRPLSPILESGLNVVWKKERLFSPAARLFLRKLKRLLADGSV